MIYFDNASTSLPKPPGVAEAVARAINTFGGVGRGVHEASLRAGMEVFETREKLAHLFKAPDARHVVFSLNATEALNIAIEGLLKPADHVITTAASHNSVLRPLYRKRDGGVALTILPVSPDGSLGYEGFERAINEQTRMVLTTHTSNLTGEVYDLGRIAELCRKRNVLFVVDAAQSAGHLELDMAKTGIDVLIFSGHKGLFGPQGVGGLCVAEGIEIPPYLVGGTGAHSFDESHPSSMPDRLEAGTLNSHGIAGLKAGLDYIEETGFEVVAHKTSALTRRFREGVGVIEGVVLYGSAVNASDLSGIVALNVGSLDSGHVSEVLYHRYGICTRSGTHCAPLMHKALHTTEQGVVRFSFSALNTQEEIDVGIAAIRDISREAEGL